MTRHLIDRERTNRFDRLLIARCGAAANHGEGRIRFTDDLTIVTCKRCKSLDSTRARA